MTSLLDRLDSLYRASIGALSLHERAIKEQDALADLRGHTGFQVLIDVFEAEMRLAFRKFLDSTDDRETLALQRRAQTVRDMIRLIDTSTTAKQRAEQAEAEARRQADLSKVDDMRQKEALAQRLRFRNHINANPG